LFLFKHTEILDSWWFK